MPTRRCSTCAVNWPILAADGINYATCPRCGEPTDYLANGNPDAPGDEMLDTARHDLFERYWQEEYLPRKAAEAEREREELERIAARGITDEDLGTLA